MPSSLPPVPVMLVQWNLQDFCKFRSQTSALAARFRLVTGLLLLLAHVTPGSPMSATIPIGFKLRGGVTSLRRCSHPADHRLADHGTAAAAHMCTPRPRAHYISMRPPAARAALRRDCVALRDMMRDMLREQPCEQLTILDTWLYS